MDLAEQIQNTITTHEAVAPLVTKLRVMKKDYANVANGRVVSRAEDGDEIVIPMQRYGFVPLMQAAIEATAHPVLDQIAKLRAPPALQIVERPAEEDAILPMSDRKQA